MERKVPTYCINDGHPFTGFIFQFPLSEDALTKKWIFDKRIFCSGPCMKCYLRKDVSNSQVLIANAELYLVRDLKLKNCPTAPDVCLIAVFNVSGKGFTIEEYRDYAKSQNYVEIPDYYPIDKNVFISEPQKNNPLPFAELIRENHCLENNSLYKRQQNLSLPMLQEEDLFAEVDVEIEENQDEEAIEPDD